MKCQNIGMYNPRTRRKMVDEERQEEKHNTKQQQGMTTHSVAPFPHTRYNRQGEQSEEHKFNNLPDGQKNMSWAPLLQMELRLTVVSCFTF